MEYFACHPGPGQARIPHHLAIAMGLITLNFWRSIFVVVSFRRRVPRDHALRSAGPRAIIRLLSTILWNGALIHSKHESRNAVSAHKKGEVMPNTSKCNVFNRVTGCAEKRAGWRFAFCFFLAASACLCSVARGQTKPGSTRLLRFPDISGNNIVFTYAGDLWSVPRSGGNAR